MTGDGKPQIPAGWIGGFAASNPAFAYPKRDLSSLDMLKNMDNINLLQRRQDVLWPEFSWETEPGNSDPKRCFQMFAPDISRLGYTDQGRVYSIICPQQGVESPSLGSINLEVTVTGQRGWVDENTRSLACDMSVEAKAWFGPGAHEKIAAKLLWKLLDDLGHDLPISKDKAIVINAHRPGDPTQPIFPLTMGENPRFVAPDFARHSDVAFSVGHLEAEIGAIEPTSVTAVDDFSRMVIDIFNMSSGQHVEGRQRVDMERVVQRSTARRPGRVAGPCRNVAQVHRCRSHKPGPPDDARPLSRRDAVPGGPRARGSRGRQDLRLHTTSYVNLVHPRHHHASRRDRRRISGSGSRCGVADVDWLLAFVADNFGVRVVSAAGVVQYQR